MLRKENVPQNKDAKGRPFTMHQLRGLFNGVRIPRKNGLDEVNNYFKTGMDRFNHIVWSVTWKFLLSISTHFHFLFGFFDLQKMKVTVQIMLLCCTKAAFSKLFLLITMIMMEENLGILIELKY